MNIVHISRSVCAGSDIQDIIINTDLESISESAERIITLINVLGT